MPIYAKTRLGNYEILDPLGAGGMGEVYRAKDLRLGRDVALKVLPAEVASSPDRLARLEREARTVAGLNHPNIVTLFSVEDANGVRFLTMELVDGQTLSDLVTPGGLPLLHLLELTIALTDALAAAHEHGVIHRDLKPGNIMVRHDGRVKVLDFGLAKLLSDPSVADSAETTPAMGRLSSAGQVLGTVPYMAPEQLRGEQVNARSDLFSLGIILYELATGRRPFHGDTFAEVSASILRDVPKPLSGVRTDLPADLEQIIGQCLEKDPNKRFVTALDANQALRRLQKVLESGGPERRTSDKVASIAVLPFVNRSHREEDEYFSDGLADELLNVLAKVKGLRVTARSSSFTFKGRQATAAEIGQALDVATLLEGSVRKSGNRIRVSVQLVNVSDNSQIWSQTYDRTLEDIFAVQDDIAQSVVEELQTTLLGKEFTAEARRQAKKEVAQAAKGRGTDPEAHRLCLVARHLIRRLTREDTAKAIGYLREALDRDPEYALAWADLSMAHNREAAYGWSPIAEATRRAREAVARALALEPDLPEGHTWMAWMQAHFDLDFRSANASVARALALSPGDAGALRLAGILAWAQGRLEEAVKFTRQALEQDPLSAAAYHNLGVQLHDVGRFEEAEAAYRKATELLPQGTGAHSAYSLTLLALGRGEEALAEARRDHESYRLYALAIIHHVLGNVAQSDTALQEISEKHAEVMAYQIAEVHGVRGEVDAAFEWLERAYRQVDGGLTGTRTSSRLRSLHADPRWGRFLKKMGLEAALQSPSPQPSS